jgi:hypothetical protein
MIIEADQVFVNIDSREPVVEILEQILGEDGFERSDRTLPLPKRYTTGDRKPYRHFFVARPESGWVCLLESCGGEKALAQKLSARLTTTSIWISYSERAEQLSYSSFSSGQLTDTSLVKPSQTQRNPSVFSLWKRRAEEITLEQQGEQLYQKYALPWPFYSYEQIDQSPNKDDYFVHLNFAKRSASP